jgi:ACS family tartrate transporter-like MFS transporter
MDEKFGSDVIKKVLLRLIPLTMLLNIVKDIDRSNISYAALQMNQDFGFTATVYGFAAGIFFLGYVAFEIPSNLVLAKIGARLWIGRIMVTWGLISMAMALISGSLSFYAMRFLLGMAEAGFLPGILYYYTLWFPAQARGKAISWFAVTAAVTNIIAAPLSTGLMTLNGLFGLRGWQLMFVVEGLPAVILGILVLRILTDRPEQANWLDDREKAWLIDTLNAEREIKRFSGATTLSQGLLDRRVWLSAAVCFFLISANYGVIFWLPQIIRSFDGLSVMEIGLLAILPYLVGAVAMVLWARHSDATGERKWHLVVSALIAATGFTVAGLAPNPAVSFLGLCLAAAGIWSMSGVFWTLPSDFLVGFAAAGGFALINSIGTTGGFFGPFIMGFVRDRTQSFSASLLVLAGFAFAGACLSAFLKNHLPTRRQRLVSAAG